MASSEMAFTGPERASICVWPIILPRGTNGPFRGLWKHVAPQIRLTIALGGGQESTWGRWEVDNGNSG
jgi:hypothetical protein